MRELAELAVAACLSGAALPPPPPPVSSFDAVINAGLDTAVEVEDRLRMRVCSNARNRGLAAARAGRSAIAAAAFAEAHTASNSIRSHTGRGVAEAFLAAAEAYLDVRHRALDLADTRLDRALALDAELERDPALVILVAHRVQLHHNRMRIDLRRGRLDEVLDRAAALLSVLEGDLDAWPLDDRRPVSLEGIPHELVTGLAVQIVSEVATATSGRRVSMTRFNTHVPPGLRCCAPGMVAIHQYLAAKDAHGSGEDEAAVALALPLLQAGPHGAPFLWAAIALDVADDLLQLPDVAAAREAIMSLDWLPQHLRARRSDRS